MKGQLATVKYLFEVAEIYPASTDGSQATEDEDCLARTLLNRLDIPTEPVGRDDEDEPVKMAKTASALGERCGREGIERAERDRKKFEPEGDVARESTRRLRTGVSDTVE